VLEKFALSSLDLRSSAVVSENQVLLKVRGAGAGEFAIQGARFSIFGTG
jgi:hypothetical protein